MISKGITIPFVLYRMVKVDKINNPSVLFAPAISPIEEALMVKNMDPSNDPWGSPKRSGMNKD